MTKAIIIDTEAKEVREVDIPGLNGDNGLAKMYEIIKCDCVQCVPLARGVDLWVDEEGLLKDRTKGFLLKGNGQPIMGTGIVAGNKAGYCSDIKVTVEQIKAIVTFIDYEDASQVPIPEIKITSF